MKNSDFHSVAGCRSIVEQHTEQILFAK